MYRLRKFLALPPAERRTLLAAVVLLGAVRAGLVVVRFPTLRRLLSQLAARRAPSPTLAAERVAWAVATAARRVPGATCLVQALAAQTLLARQGHPTDLRIGVAREDEGISAHAWLERDGQPVYGAPDPSRHTVLPPLESRPA